MGERRRKMSGKKIVFIPENVPSSKNSKVITPKGLFMSKTVRRYLQKIGVKKYSVSQKTVENYKTRPNLFAIAVKQMREDLKHRAMPVIVGFHFVRGSKRKFDFHNMCQVVADLLVAHDVIPDDDMTHFIPEAVKVGGKWYSVCKGKPGVYLYY